MKGLIFTGFFILLALASNQNLGELKTNSNQPSIQATVVCPLPDASVDNRKNESLQNDLQPGFEVLTKDNFMDKKSIAFIYAKPEFISSRKLTEIVSLLNNKNGKKERLALFFFDDLKLAQAFMTGKIGPRDLEIKAKAVFLHEGGKEYLKIRNDSQNRLDLVFEYEVVGENCFNRSKCSTAVYTAENFFNDLNLIQLSDFLKQKNKKRKLLQVFFYDDLKKATADAKAKQVLQKSDSVRGIYYDSSRKYLKYRFSKDERASWIIVFDS